MTKIIKLDACDECGFNHQTTETQDDENAFLGHTHETINTCILKYMIISEPATIPDWCPLDDACNTSTPK